MLQKIWSYGNWFARQLHRQFVERDCLSNAASLTYTTLFAVVPLMTVAYRTLSMISDFSAIGETVQSFIFSNFVPQSSAVIQEQLSQFSEQANRLTGFSVAFLVVTAFMMLVTIEKAFNRIWHISEPRRGFQRILLYWGVMTFGPPLLGAGVLISSYLISLPLLTGLDSYGFKETLLSYMPFLFSSAVFTFLYYAVPNTRVPFKQALLGGLLTMILFELAKSAFSSIVAHSNFATIYGAFAAVPLFLFWLYLVWALVLIGAIVVRTLSLTPEMDEGRQPPLLVQCLVMLQKLHEAHMEGRGLRDQELTNAIAVSQVRRDRIFSVLENMNILGLAEDGSRTLARNLRGVSLWSLYREFPEGLELDRLKGVNELPQAVSRLREFVSFGAECLALSVEDLFSQPVKVTGS